METLPPAPDSVEELARLLGGFKRKRYATKAAAKASRTQAVTRTALAADRPSIFAKTGGKCHVCGGQMAMADDWEADHVTAHAAGGSADADNFLPAHRRCNSYRWDRPPEELGYVRALGAWLRREINNETAVGRRAAAAYRVHEDARKRRRKMPDSRDDECPELRLGVWIRTHIEKLTAVGRATGAEYLEQLKRLKSAGGPQRPLP